MTVMIDGEMVLYGFVGESFWDDGFTAREVVDALAEHGRTKDLTVRINSGGGYVDAGIAIFNALSAHKGKVTVVVDAIAASSASIIFMAGADRIMRKGSMVMIHDPATVVWGTAEDMNKAVQMLEKHAENLAEIYADVTGEDVDDVRADMKAETWLTAEEAVERGFATAANDSKAKAAAAYDYSVYAHAPERLVALTSKKNWSHSEARPRALASATQPQPSKGVSRMTDKIEADETAAKIENATKSAAAQATADTKARIKAITTADAAKGREALATHFAYETDMTPEAAIAALSVAPTGQAPDPVNVVVDPGKVTADAYEANRLKATGLVQPAGGSQADRSVSAKSLNPASIYSKRRETQKGA